MRVYQFLVTKTECTSRLSLCCGWTHNQEENKCFKTEFLKSILTFKFLNQSSLLYYFHSSPNVISCLCRSVGGCIIAIV
jgi:hypothetical protein